MTKPKSSGAGSEDWYVKPIEERIQARPRIPDAADQTEALKAVAHFIVDFKEKTGEPLKCPACGSAELFPISFEVSSEYDTTVEDVSMHPQINVAPAAVVGCSRCPGLLRFSWLWIKERYGK